MKRFTHVSPLLLAAVVVVASAGCRDVGDASVLVDLVDDRSQPHAVLVDVEARLTLTDEDGDHPDVTLRNVDADDEVVVGKDVPLVCNDFGCEGNLQVEPGAYQAALVVSAVDRCGTRGPVLAYAGAFEVGHWDSTFIALELDDASFDGDDDGVIDVLEAVSCGRFDFDEGPRPPRECSAERAICCADRSDAEGGMQGFDGGTTTLPYDGGAATAVPAFALDATEVTWGQVERCVLAGVCLVDAPDHPARAALATAVDRREPARGLLPIEAADVCAYYGKSLPDDAAWDFAAADRGGVRARYPFDVVDGVAIGCRETGEPPAAAHRQAGTSCPRDPLPVGSYATSPITRGSGTPLFDLAGNVAEWTLVRDDGSDGGVVDEDGDGVPDGVSAVVLRGGGVGSFVELLENDLPLVFETASAADLLALRAAAPEVGFRCAAPVAVVVDDEPSCPAE